MEDREGTRPDLHAAELGKVRIGGVEDPLTEGVKEDVGGQTGGKHHAAPCEGRIFRLFSRLSETDIPVSGEGQIEGEEKDAEADDEIIEAKGVS